MDCELFLNFLILGCIYRTVVDNYSLIFDEIEDDIMNETMETIKKRACHDTKIQEIIKIKSRSKKAYEFINKIQIKKAYEFMKFVLVDTVIRLEFIKVFKNRSQYTLMSSKCTK